MSEMPRPIRRLRRPWRTRAQIEGEADEEIAFHLEMRTTELVRRGAEPEAARRQALREFGDLKAARRSLRASDEEAQRRRRHSDWWAELGQDAGFALRSFLHRESPQTNSANITLSMRGCGTSSWARCVRRRFPGENPLGRRLGFDSESWGGDRGRGGRHAAEGPGPGQPSGAVSALCAVHDAVAGDRAAHERRPAGPHALDPPRGSCSALPRPTRSRSSRSSPCCSALRPSRATFRPASPAACTRTWHSASSEAMTPGSRSADTMSRAGRWAARAAAASLACGLAWSPAPAAAQRADTVRVRRDTVVYPLAPIEVHTSIVPVAGPRIGSGVPARVQVLSRRRIEAWEPRILPDILASEAGVSLYDDLGSPFKLNLTTRGFTAGPTVGLPAGVSVFLDGVRQNEADAQEVNFDLLPMEHVRRVELLSGAASLLGPNSLGGAINLITDRGEGPPHGAVELSSGSFGAYAGQASFSALSRGGWATYLGAGYAHENGWREATGATQYNGFLNLGRTGERRGLRLQAFATRSRAETAGSLPESLFHVSPRTNFTAGDYEDLNTAQLSLSGYAPVGAGRGSVTLFARRFGAERFNVNQPPDANVLGRTSNHTLGGTIDWRWARAWPDATLGVRGGVDGALNAARVRIFEVAQGVGDPAAAAGEPSTSVRSPSSDIAGYALADMSIGRVTVSGGARYDLVRVPFRDELDPTGDATHTFRRLSPRGGASVEVGRVVVAYASVGQSFRAPAILELGCADPEATCPLPFALGEDPPLRPVRATTYELGGRWTTAALAVSASLYRSEVRDEIFFVAADAARLSGYFTNLARTRREGAELSLEGALAGERLSWYANYAHTRATFQSPIQLFSIRSEDEFEDSPLAGENAVRPGDRLPLVPAHQARAGALARLPRGASLGLDLRWTGKQWLRGDEANETEPLHAYLVLNGRAGLELGPWELSATLTNLLDSHRALFGTFNENRRTGSLERFLTPLNARSVKVILRRRIAAGGEGDDG